MPNPRVFSGHGAKSGQGNKLVVRAPVVGHISKGIWVIAKSSLATPYAKYIQFGVLINRVANL